MPTAEIGCRLRRRAGGGRTARTFRRLALGVLLVSCIPNLLAAFGRDAGVEWAMLALMAMHVVAWAVTVAMLTRLTLNGTTAA